MIHVFLGRLRLRRASDYKYLNQSDCLEIQKINDAQKFHILMVMQLYLHVIYIGFVYTCNLVITPYI